MAELTHPEVVYSPRSIQLWRALWNWLAFFFQIFLQILRAVGPRSLSTPSHTFKPLPLGELPETTDPPPATVEIPAGTDAISANEPIQKLTVWYRFSLVMIVALKEGSVCVLIYAYNNNNNNNKRMSYFFKRFMIFVFARLCILWRR